MAKIGDLRGIAGEFTFEWKIKNFSSLSEEKDTYYYSPIFYFSGASWVIKIYPHGETLYKSDDCIGVYLERRSFGSSITVKCAFGFSADDQRKDPTKDFTRTFHEKYLGFGFCKFISRSTFTERKSELLPSDTLTVICTLTNCEPNDNVGSLFNRLQNVSDNLSDIYKKGKRTDLLLKLDGGNIRAHRMILETRSPVFAAMFSHDTKENQTGEVSINDVDKSVMEVLISQMYSGDLEKLTTQNVLSVYAAAEKYDIKDAKELCVMFILRNLSVEWVCDVIKFAEFYQVEEVANRAREYFKENGKKILESDKWEKFAKENQEIGVQLLATLLKSLLPN